MIVTEGEVQFCTHLEDQRPDLKVKTRGEEEHVDLETWQPGWALLLSLAHPALISLLPLSQGVAKKWVIKGGETVGSVGGGRRSWRNRGWTHAQGEAGT